MNITWMRMTIVLQLIGWATLAHADPSVNGPRISSECCYSQLAMNTAQKAEAFCRQHQHQILDAEGADPCKLEKDAVQQYANEYAHAADKTGTCGDDCRPAPIN